MDPPAFLCAGSGFVSCRPRVFPLPEFSSMEWGYNINISRDRAVVNLSARPVCLIRCVFLSPGGREHTHHTYTIASYASQYTLPLSISAYLQLGFFPRGAACGVVRVRSRGRVEAAMTHLSVQRLLHASHLQACFKPAPFELFFRVGRWPNHTKTLWYSSTSVCLDVLDDECVCAFKCGFYSRGLL